MGRARDAGTVVEVTRCPLQAKPENVGSHRNADRFRKRVHETRRRRACNAGQCFERNTVQHGTRLVIVVNPRRRTATMHRPGEPERVLAGDDVLDGADVVPGWTVPLKELFANG